MRHGGSNSAALTRFRLSAFTFALILAALTSPVLMHGQFAKKSARPGTAMGSSGDGLELMPGENPVIRLAVGHWHAFSICTGYLYFSRDSIRYEVVQPENDKSHAFDFKRSELTYAGPWRQLGSTSGYAELKFREAVTAYHFVVLQKSAVESATRLSPRDAVRNSINYQDLVNAANNFNDVLATLQAKEARLRPPPASPPTIGMLEPNGAEAGRTVDVPRAGLHLRGIASHASGITAVSVNGQTAFLKTLAPQTVEFDVQSIPVNPGLSAVVVLATASDKSQGQLIFTANRSEVRILDPASNSQTAEPSVKVRGLALGFHDVERVEVSGVGAVLRKKDSGEIEFEAERVPLSLGSNTLQGFVTARNGVRENFQVAVKRLPPAGPPPLTLQEVQEALQGGVPPARVSSLVTKFGVDFTLTDESEKALRAAGADSNLLVVVAKSKK